MEKGYKLQSTRADYMTPNDLIQSILYKEGVEKFDLDVCCHEENIPANEYYKAVVDERTGKVISIINDGLKLDWKKLNWCNPPFNESRKWLKKALQEQEKGNSTWLIIPFRPETQYWDYVLCQKGLLNNRIFENDYVHCEIWKKGFQFIDPVTRREAGIFKNPLALLKLKGITNKSADYKQMDLGL